jgi:hypothetical protein
VRERPLGFTFLEALRDLSFFNVLSLSLTHACGVSGALKLKPETLTRLVHLHCGRATGSRGMGSRIIDSSGRSTTSRILTYGLPKDRRMDRMGRPRSKTARERARTCYSYERRCKRVGSRSHGLLSSASPPRRRCRAALRLLRTGVRVRARASPALGLTAGCFNGTTRSGGQTS